MISVNNLAYSIGTFSLNVTLSVARAEYFVLLGMTGSGKTLLLENICGLRTPASGQIIIGDADVTALEPRKRGIGYVPQDGALFDHLDVAGNIAFARKVAGASRQEQEQETARVAGMLGIGHLLGRNVQGLSGGERQRVALARALVCRPGVLLLDEPVSALDEYTREKVCRELKTLQQSLCLSVVHICHSFEEASLVADRVGVIHQGSILQAGTPDELVHVPCNIDVARVLRLENIFAGSAVRRSNAGCITCNGVTLTGPACLGDIVFYVRPWQIETALQTGGEQPNIVEGSIAEVGFAGPLVKVRLNGSIPLIVFFSRKEAEQQGVRVNAPLRLWFPPSAIHVLSQAAR